MITILNIIFYNNKYIHCYVICLCFGYQPVLSSPFLHNHAEEKKKQASQDSLIASEHPEPHPSRPLASSRVSSLTLWRWEERSPLCRWLCVVSISGLWDPCTLNCQVVSLTRISYIHGYVGRLLRNWTKTKKTKLYVLVSKDSWTVGYPEREKTGSIILIWPFYTFQTPPLEATKINY